MVFWDIGFLRPVVHCCKEIQLCTELRVLPSGTCSSTPDVENFTMAYQSSKHVINSLRKVDSEECDKMNHHQSTNLTIVRALMLDLCSLSQWSSSFYSTILSRGSISDGWYLLVLEERDYADQLSSCGVPRKWPLTWLCACSIILIFTCVFAALVVVTLEKKLFNLLLSLRQINQFHFRFSFKLRLQIILKPFPPLPKPCWKSIRQ